MFFYFIFLWGLFCACLVSFHFLFFFVFFFLFPFSVDPLFFFACVNFFVSF
eukprot:TRINITY_DN7943_c0_g1_i1.p2 TRINITY_DN7943_c0_g1~~TRINITY_DN7943_c0_g1_i1.p2  ORF type:complete len:51 (-),score=11.69 TRINITY_DN7943_c0_g1_i1:145-297(-)